MRAIAVERGDNRVFHRPGAAQPSVRQLLDRRRAPRRAGPSAADRHPSGAPSRREVGLRQRRERDDRRARVLRRERRHRAVEGEVGIDLVGEQRDVVGIGDVEQRLARRGRIGRAGRVVRIDDDEGARRAAIPGCGCDRRPAASRCRGRSGRTPRARRSWRARRCRADRSASAPALRRPLSASAVSASSIPSEVPDVMTTRSGDIGMPRCAHSAATASRAGRDPDRRCIAVVPVTQRARHRFDHVRRRLEAERDRIADVQVADLLARRLDALGLGHDVADGVGEAADADRRQGSSRWCAASRRQFINKGSKPSLLTVRSAGRHLECKSDSR